MRVEQTEVYRDWINALKDRAGCARIQVRVDRLVHGISEIKIDFGPGYRVYYTQRGDRLLLLLVGGNKSTHQKDIECAIELVRGLQE
jgi:putative addiction module killer protein